MIRLIIRLRKAVANPTALLIAAGTLPSASAVIFFGDISS